MAWSLRFAACVAVILLFEGATISETNKEKLELVVPAAHFVGASPQVGGPDVLSVQYPFEAYDNGSEAPVIATYVSVDSTL